MDLGSMSEKAQADIASLLGTVPTPEIEEDSTAVEEPEKLESDDESEDDSTPDVEASEEGSDEVDLEDGETQTPEADIEYIKANGKRVKIDFSDRENIKRVYSMAAGARQWQAERDSEKAKNAELTKSHSELKETMDYLESIKEDHETLFEAVTGESLNDKFKQWAEEQNLIGGMTESEKSMYLSNQDHKKRIRDVEKREKELQVKLEGVTTRDEEAKKLREESIANPIFFKYNFDGELGNDQLELRMNKALWSEAREELSAYDKVTPDMVEETFDRISNQIRGGFKTSAERSVKKTVKAQRKAVKKKAQAMAVANPKSDRKAELDKLIKAGDIAGALQYGDVLSTL